MKSFEFFLQWIQLVLISTTYECIEAEPYFILLSGEVPYPDIATPRALVSFLSSGRRMPRPDHCTEEL